MSDDSGLGSGGYDWNTEDELEIESFHSSCTTVPYGQTSGSRSLEENSFAAGPSNTKVFDSLINMGFHPEMVAKVIQEYGEENEHKLVEELLTYQELERSSQQQQQVEPDPTSSEYAASSWDDSSDNDDSSDEEIPKSLSKNDNTLLSLVKMGFNEEEALMAVERLGPNSSLEELVDFISVAQLVKSEDALLPPEDKPQCNGHAKPRKRTLYESEVLGRKKPKVFEKRTCEEDDEAQAIHLPNPMVGFGIPTDPNSIITHRRLPHDANGPPYFYYENVALTPKGVWQTISRFLYDVEPEYVDSKYFCAAARKRGYIHNLPIANRYPLLPLPARTIQDAFPLLKKWWPSWDPRTKLNCLQTVHASAKLTQRIRAAVEQLQDFDDPPENVKKYVLEQCRKWNLVWVGKNKVAPLEPDEVEILLGFPKYHTRGGGISRTDRFKSLGNSFQVDTVAYHLSVLKEMFPDGINVLSLFSGIGGAEVALHKLGVLLKNVVSVETKIPFLGNVYLMLSDITIYQIDVASSVVKPGESGISIVASGVSCNLSMNWYYDYSTWIGPVKVSDQGLAHVQVEGMEVELSLGLENQEGSLDLKLKNCDSSVKDISIKLDGGASWLYQGVIDAFEGNIGSAVENAITKKLGKGISKLDSYLKSLPKEVPVDDHSSLNVTIINDVLLSESSVGFETNGLFIQRNDSVHIPNLLHKNSKLPILCTNSSKMLAITLDEAVFNSASALYYDAKFMHWIVDQIPDQSLLNTAGWRFIIPQLYKKYPNHRMNLNISLSSPPVVEISNQKAGVHVFADLTIDVLEENEVIPVACISLMIQASGLVKINGNNLVGTIRLDDFGMSLKWSNIGNLRMFLIQPAMWTIIETVFLPYANSHLSKGLPLPIIHGFTLQDAEIILSTSKVGVCSDVSFAESNKHFLQFIM